MSSSAVAGYGALNLDVLFQMTPNEILTLVVSAAAIVVSCVSLYFSTWHKKISLVGCLVRCEVPSAEDGLSNTYEFSLSNTGNQELLLREVHVELVSMQPGELIPELSVEDVPQVIKPGAVVMLKVPIPHRFTSRVEKENRNMKLSFEVFTPKAKKKYAYKELSPSLENKDGWKPFRLE